MSLEQRIRDINRGYVERSLKIGGNRYIGMGKEEETYITPSKNLGVAVGGKRPSQNLTPEEKKERARLSAEKFRNKKKGNLLSNIEVNEPVSEEEGEQPEGKHITKQVYKNKHNKRIEVIQTIDVKTMDDKPRKGTKTFNGGKKGIKKGGYSWEKFLDDADDTAETAGHIAHQFLPMLGLGKKKGIKKGGRTEPNITGGEPVQTLTLQHIREHPHDLYTPAGVMFSHYTPPDQMRDQSIRPDLPLDQGEVIAPPHQLSEWQAFKRGFEIPFKAVASAFGGKKGKRVYKKKSKVDMEGGSLRDFLFPKYHTVINKYGGLDRIKGPAPKGFLMIEPKPTPALATPATPTPAPVAPATPATPPTTGAGKKTSKWIDFVKAYSKKHNMKYNEALKDAKCKSEYHNSK
jgi:hypothetical protein